MFLMSSEILTSGSGIPRLWAISVSSAFRLVKRDPVYDLESGEAVKTVPRRDKPVESRCDDEDRWRGEKKWRDQLE